MASEDPSDLTTDILILAKDTASELPSISDINNVQGRAEASSACSLPGFEGIDWKRLRGYKLPTDNYDYKSWVWLHGWRLFQESDKSYWWLCKACPKAKHTTKRLCEVKFCTTKATIGVLNHMIAKHNRDKNGELVQIQDKPKKRKWSLFNAQGGNGYDRETERDNELAVTFSSGAFQAYLYQWLIAGNIAFRKTQSSEFAALLQYLNPRCKLPHPTTVSRTLAQLYERFNTAQRTKAGSSKTFRYGGTPSSYSTPETACPF